jgi:sensor histidine kinase YesM
MHKSNIHRPLVFHSVLWILAFVVLIFVFTKGKRPVRIDYLYTISFLVLISIPVCLNFYILMPRFLKQERYLNYVIAFILNASVFGYIIFRFFQPLIDSLFPSYFFISYLTHNNLIIVVAIFLVSSTLMKLAEDWFYFNASENKRLKFKNQQIETQLFALRSQINPHFLFNSLNVIYALALDKKSGITKAIVELSDILRYVIYDSDTERVQLKDEILLLKNFIAFQNYRLETPHKTELNIDVENKTFEIYPMLLLPLLENSYKHGTISGTDTAPIKIKLQQKGTKFLFRISNPILHTQNQLKNEHSGIGLENLRNNLALVYPNRHIFEIETNDDIFKVKLELQTDVE